MSSRFNSRLSCFGNFCLCRLLLCFFNCLTHIDLHKSLFFRGKFFIIAVAVGSGYFIFCIASSDGFYDGRGFRLFNGSLFRFRLFDLLVFLYRLDDRLLSLFHRFRCDCLCLSVFYGNGFLLGRLVNYLFLYRLFLYVFRLFSLFDGRLSVFLFFVVDSGSRVILGSRFSRRGFFLFLSGSCGNCDDDYEQYYHCYSRYEHPSRYADTAEFEYFRSKKFHDDLPNLYIEIINIAYSKAIVIIYHI